MKNIKISKITILICIAAVIVIGLIIHFIIKLIKLPPKTYGTDIDKSEQIYDTSFKNLINDASFLNVYNTLEYVNNFLMNPSFNDNRKEIMIDILDSDYKDYYNLKKGNVIEHVKPYIGKQFIIENVKEAQTLGSYSTFLITALCENEEKYLIMRVDYATLSFSLFLPDYVEEYGIENYIENILMKNESIKNNNYNKFEMKTYTTQNKLQIYSEIMSKYDFEFIYANFIGDDTKNNYSKDEIKKLYENEDSFFKRSAFVDLKEYNSEDYTEYKYTFKDRKMNEYTIIDKGSMDIKLDFTIAPEEEIVNIDGGGLLEIIEQGE